jgi:type II secretory pathway component PulM
MAGGRGGRAALHFGRPGVERAYRGSPKRIRRIRWQEHTPREFVVLIVVGVAIVVALISWLVTHPEAR